MIFPSRFAGKVLLVTGAAQGLGEAVATRAAREGGAVALVDRSEIVHEVSEKLTSEGAQTISLIADLEQHGDCAAIMAKAHERFGRIDILINNVGGTIWAKPYAHYQPRTRSRPRSDDRSSRRCGAAVRCCRTSSNRGTAPSSTCRRSPLGASTGFRTRRPRAGSTRSRRRSRSEYAERASGWSRPRPAGSTPRSDASRAAPPPRRPSRKRRGTRRIVDQTIDSSLLHRYGTLDEEAAPILFLASDEASYITGTRLPVAGGDLG